MNEYIEQLSKEALKLGICAYGEERMFSSDLSDLVDYYISVPNWGMEREFPSLKELREHFSNFEEKGVFVDKEFHGELLNDLQTYIFHHCKGTVKVGLNVDKAIIPMIYIGNGCRLRFVGVGEYKPQRAEERTEIPVYIFGKNDVSARSNMYVHFIKHNTAIK